MIFTCKIKRLLCCGTMKPAESVETSNIKDIVFVQLQKNDVTTHCMDLDMFYAGDNNIFNSDNGYSLYMRKKFHSL